MGNNLEQEVAELIESFEDLILSAKQRVSMCKWYVENKPSSNNSQYLENAEKQLSILERNYTDLKEEWDSDGANAWENNINPETK